jgi:hypothetical protein
MKVLVCGSRFYTHYSRILQYVRGLEDAVIIAGGARGADTLAVKAAKACGFTFREYPANWAKYGKKAGPIRNQTMLDMESPDIVVAFHEDIDSSKGTKDMVSRARKSGVPVLIFK